MNRPWSFLFTVAMLIAGVVFAGWNWALRPDRALAWAFSLAFAVAAAIAFFFASRRIERRPAQEYAAEQIRIAVLLAAAIMAISLGARVAATTGLIVGQDLSTRITMVLLGAYFAITGNLMPKMLTPLSAQRCDPARAQAIQRTGGRAWLLAGVTFAIVWMTLPVDVAEPVSIAVLAAAAILVVTQCLRLRRRTPATPGGLQP